NSGALCVQPYDQDVSQGTAAIGLFDRTSFHPFLDLPADWKGTIELLFVYQSQSGDVWVGGNQGIAVHRQGQWQTFDRNQGYLGEGAQCLLETQDGKLWCGSRDHLFEF